MNDPFDNIRVINLVILGLVITGLIVSAFVYRHREVNVKGVALLLFALSGFYGTLESLVQTSTPGFRSISVLIVGLVALILVYAPLVESMVDARRKFMARAKSNEPSD